MKSGFILICTVAFVLIILTTVLYQTPNSYSQQLMGFRLPDKFAAKSEVKRNQQAGNILPSRLQEDNATNLLITEGSSTTEGYGVTNEYPRQLAVLFGGNYYKQLVNLIIDSGNQWTVRNVGNGGDTMTQIISEYNTQVLPFYNPSLRLNYLTLQGGSNDIANGRTITELKTDVAAYVAKAKADGFRVGVCTVFHRVGNDVGKVNDYNNWLRAGNSGADFIIDLAADPLLSDATNLMYFQGDGIHTNNAGQTIIAGIFADAIATVKVTSLVIAVSGRVENASGMGISKVTISIRDSTGNVRITTTDSSGAYRFADIQANGVYTISASAKRFIFAQPSQSFNAADNDVTVNFIAGLAPSLRNLK